MSGAGHYYSGLLALGLIAASLGLAAWRLRARFLPRWRGAPGRLCEAVIWVSLLLVSSELVGLVGAFTRVGLVLGAVTVGGGVVLAVHRFRPAVENAERPPGESARIGGPIALAAAAATALHWAAPIRQSYEIGIYKQDSPWYHLSDAARFVQDHSITGLHFTDPLKLAAWFYPLNSEVFHAVGMAAIGNDTLSPLLNLGWMLLALLAVWCIGRPFGAGLPCLLGAVVVFNTSMMLLQAGNAPSDTPSLFFLLAAVAVLVNADAANEGGAPSVAAAVVAGLAAGLAFGTKITLLPLIGAITLIVLVRAREHHRPSIGWAWVIGGAATSSFWYLRNLAHSGNPLPWFRAGPIPGPDQLPIYPRPPRSVAQVAFEPRVWTEHFFPAFRDVLGIGWPLILLGTLGGFALVLWRPRASLHRSLAAAGVISALAYAFTPITASGYKLLNDYSGIPSNLRYLSPALLLGLTLLPLARPFASRLNWVSVAFGALALVTAIDAGSWTAHPFPGALLLVLVVVVTPVVVSLALARGVGVRPALAAAAVGVVALAVVGRSIENDYLPRRYQATRMPLKQSPGYRATKQWRRMVDWGRRQHDQRIGIAGLSAAYSQYFFYGADLSNRVDYLGLHRPHGGLWPIATCPKWRAAVNAGHYDYVLATPESQRVTGPPAPELVWTRGANAHRVVYGGSGAVFRIDGRLDPASCPAPK